MHIGTAAAAEWQNGIDGRRICLGPDQNSSRLGQGTHSRPLLGFLGLPSAQDRLLCSNARSQPESVVQPSMQALQQLQTGEKALLICASAVNFVRAALQCQTKSVTLGPLTLRWPQDYCLIDNTLTKTSRAGFAAAADRKEGLANLCICLGPGHSSAFWPWGPCHLFWDCGADSGRPVVPLAV